DVGQPRGFREGGGDERGRGMLRAVLILQDAPGEALLQSGGQDLVVDVLVGGAELIAPSVGAFELQAPRLPATALLLRLQAAGEGLQVEHLDLERRRPEGAVFLAEEQ